MVLFFILNNTTETGLRFRKVFLTIRASNDVRKINKIILGFNIITKSDYLCKKLMWSQPNNVTAV
jgi:hypothetical protein